ncbi:MAG TPA: type II toxin-antitoxin system RelE/ParE family toxin [Alphaproteobacteria bacterium]|nr:type II toxin-antitoxin system RelE/ParE family toxin [Alphaproteobacteria bacterium]
MKLRWTRPALRDLSDIHAHIAEHNPAAALKVARIIRAQAEVLTAHSMIGHLGRVNGTRELVVTGYPYVVAYRIGKKTVDLLAVRHTARLWPPSYPDK